MAPSLSRGIALVYVLRLRSGNLYVGSSDDAEPRFAKHEEGTACRMTNLDPPCSVVWVEIQPNFLTARSGEAQIKKWSRAKKEALIAGDMPRLRALSKSRD
jgi:predicted GIY-YIG superfamily endonuclease